MSHPLIECVSTQTQTSGYTSSDKPTGAVASPLALRLAGMAWPYPYNQAPSASKTAWGHLNCPTGNGSLGRVDL